jgi:hypothetical protein
VDTCNRTCLLVGQTAALLAHASYAAAGPVNRVDGDANNDPIHPAQQRLWKCSFLLDWHSFQVQDVTPVTYLANLEKSASQRPADHAQHPSTLF